MQQNCPFDTWHAMMSVFRENKIYCKNCKVFFLDGAFKWFLRIGCTNGMLCILFWLNWSHLSTRRMCNTAYRVSDNMKDQCFMNLYIHQMFSPSHWARANLGWEASWFSSLVSNSLRSDGLSNVGLSFCECITEMWFKIDRISTLTEFIPLGTVAKWLCNRNIITKKFLSWNSAFSSFDRWWSFHTS